MHPVSDLLFFDTREDASIDMTGSLQFSVSPWNFSHLLSEELSSSVAWCFWGFFYSLRQSWPSNLVREKTIVLFVPDHRTSLFVIVRHDWNYTSRNIVHVPSTESFPLRRLSFLFEWLILSTTSFRALKFRILIIWSIWSFTDVFNRKQLVWPLFRTVFLIAQSRDGLRLKQSLVNLDWYNPCRIASWKHISCW